VTVTPTITPTITITPTNTITPTPTLTPTVSPDIPTADINTTSTSCFGGSDGTIVVSNLANGSGSPYYVKLNSGVYQEITGTTYTFTNLTATTYTITIKDSIGTEKVYSSISVTQPTEQFVTIDNYVTTSGSTGEITITSTGGTWPKTYSVYEDTSFPYSTCGEGSSIQTITGVTEVNATQTFTGLSAGCFCITVIDDNGCSTNSGIQCIYSEDPVPCSTGMDVVFVVDYTGSMGGEIDAIKNDITQIANTIVTESSGNYQLGLTIVDEYSGSTTLPAYYNSTFYENLPTSQKFVNQGQNNRYQWITAMEMMSYQNVSTFIDAVEILRTTNFPLGNGQDTPEPTDLAASLVGNSNFNGQYRNGVNRLMIIITDAVPGGDDDVYNDEVFIEQLVTDFNNKNITVLLMSQISNNPLEILANGTGGIVTGLTPTEIINAINNICS
jgi:hypothetical protein